jgi:hypothetical protein
MRNGREQTAIGLLGIDRNALLQAPAVEDGVEQRGQTSFA